MTVVDLVVRPSVILLAGLLLSVMLKRQSASVRHLVLGGALLASAAVVPLSLAVPSWEVSWPAAGPPDQVAAADPVAAVERTSAAPVHAAVDARLAAVTSSPGWLVVIWLGGALASGGALLGGLFRLWRISARSERMHDASCLQTVRQAAAQLGMARMPLVCRTDVPGLVATWGFFRPLVLLPARVREWDEGRLHAVLCHEFAHIQRCDWFVQMAAEYLRAVYWFNPLFWMACTRLRRESEQACDDAVLRAGVPARDYAVHLVDVARSCRPAGLPALLMARPPTLERRIAAMLNQTINRDPVSGAAIVAAVLLLLAVSVPVAALRAAQDGPLPLTGVIYDPSGAVVPSVELTLQDAQEITWQATTGAAGEFEFPAVHAGRYVLEAKLPGFRSLRHEFELQRAGDWNRAITLQVGDLRETIVVQASRLAPSVESTAQGPQPVRVGGNIKAPLKIRHVNPVYPVSMREAGRSGVVPIEAVIGTDGWVVSLRVLGAHVHPDFAAAAMDAVRQWRFTPTLLNGSPVEVKMTVTVTFDLAG